MLTTSSCSFSLRFLDAGPLMGSVDADDLASALAAATDVFDCINKIANNGETKASLRVDEGTRDKGFSVAMTLTQEADDQASFLEVPSPDGDLGAKQAVQVLLQLIQLKRKLRGKNPLKTDAALLPGYVTVYADLETVLEVWELSLRCYEDGDCAKAVARLASPLRRGKGTTSLTVSLGSDAQTLATGEASAFSVGKTTGAQNASVVRLSVEVESPAFKFGRKWQINLGSTSVPADLEDPAFWQRIEERQETFAYGDLLDVDLHVTRIDEGGKMKSVYKIQKVYGHRGPGTQPSLL